MTLRLMVDSADPKNWERFLRRGWVYGATTNPLILKRDGWSVDRTTYRTLVDEAKRLGLRELHIQATGSSANELTESGLFIAGLWDHVWTTPALQGEFDLIFIPVGCGHVSGLFVRYDDRWP